MNLNKIIDKLGITNAFGLMEHEKIIASEARRQNQVFEQTNELKKQNLTLEEMKLLTGENSEQIKQLVECTIRNQKSANKQFWASIIIALAVLIVAIIK